MTIEERLDRLERQNHRLKGGLGLLLLTVVAVGVLGFAGQDKVPDVVKAKAFHVVGKDGTVLVKLEDSLGTGAGLFGTVMTMNSKGQTLVELAVSQTADEGEVRTLNGKGQELVRLATTIAGHGAVLTTNSKGQTLVALGVSNDGGHGVVRTLNDKGQTLVRLAAINEGGHGAVSTMNSKGQELVRLMATADGGMVYTMNDKSQALVMLWATAGGEGAVTVFDPSGRERPFVLTTRPPGRQKRNAATPAP